MHIGEMLIHISIPQNVKQFSRNFNSVLEQLLPHAITPYWLVDKVSWRLERVYVE